MAFALIALLGFGVARWMAPPTVTDSLDGAALQLELQRLEETLGRAATDEERADASARWKQREVLYHEAIKLGMGEQDPVVKTQLVRAMTHMLRSSAPRRPPTEDELLNFLRAHKDRYGQPARWSFDLVRGPGNQRALPRDEADALLEAIEIDGLDAVPLAQLDARHHRPHRALVSEFGEAFARTVEAAPIDSWRVLAAEGGWVLVRVSRVGEAVEPKLDDVREKLTEDWQRAIEAAHVEDRLEQLSAGYTVHPPIGGEDGSP